MDFTDKELLDLIPKQDLRAVSRMISLTENGSPRARNLQAQLFATSAHKKKPHIVGVTGAPGAGKSTLVDQIACSLRLQNKKVAIVAIDPTSPFSGGAILGDRIRMVKTAEDEQVFIRSMATRGALGGVSRATLDAVQILEAAGFDYILIETVGVGQAEVDIVRMADTCLVVLVPGMGDSVQAFKAGILEIADTFVINKADRDGVDLIFRDVRLLVSLGNYPEGSWTPEIIKTIAVNGQGTSELIEQIHAHKVWLETSDLGKARKQLVMKETLLSLVCDQIRSHILKQHNNTLEQLALECAAKKKELHCAANDLQKLIA